MPSMKFDPQSLYQGNIRKYERRLTSPMMKFNDRGMVFVTWYQVRDDKSTYDQGFRQPDQTIGRQSGIRYNKIEHLGISLQNETDVNVQEEVPGVLDISHEGSLLVFPNTIVPNPNVDYFVIEHLQMLAIFRITDIDYDHMRVDGYRKCGYILEGTDREFLDQLERQTVDTYVMKYDDFGTEVSPIIRKDHYEYGLALEKVYSDMVDLYIHLFYNERHECLLWYDMNRNKSVYDECLQQFVSNHSLLSIPNSSHIAIFEEKLQDPQFPFLYGRSIFRWMERDAPPSQLEKFRYTISSAERYIDSTFYQWGHVSFCCSWPTVGNTLAFDGTYLDDRMYRVLSGDLEPNTPYEQVLRLFTSGQLSSPEQIPLGIYQELLDGTNSFQLFLLTPLVMFVIRKVLQFH